MLPGAAHAQDIGGIGSAMSGAMTMMIVVGIIVLALAVGIVVFFMRNMSRGIKAGESMARTYQTSSDAIGTLDKRLANGEIDEAEYKRLRDALERNARR